MARRKQKADKPQTVIVEPRDTDGDHQPKFVKRSHVPESVRLLGVPMARKPRKKKPGKPAGKIVKTKEGDAKVIPGWTRKPKLWELVPQPQPEPDEDEAATDSTPSE